MTFSQNDSNPWIFAGLAGSLPDLKDDITNITSKTKLTDTTTCAGADKPSCLIINPSSAPPAPLSVEEATLKLGLEPQVLVFRYRSKVHAIDHACPHSSYPLSRGSLYDIEDFGIILSAGVTCPKHGWAFDLFTGESDRGKYRLGVWEVEVKGEAEKEEVWIRRKKRARIG